MEGNRQSTDSPRKSGEMNENRKSTDSQDIGNTLEIEEDMQSAYAEMPGEGGNYPEETIIALEDEEEETDVNRNDDTTAVGDLTTTQGYLPPNQLQQTLGIVKPDAIRKAEEIITIIHREGFTILQARRVKLTAEQAASFYQDMYDTPWFQGCVENLSSGQSLAMVLSGPGAVKHWTQLCGPMSWEERSKDPKCLRFQYGTKEDNHKNAVHCSETPEDALRELHFFFPELIVEPTIATNLASVYLNQNVHPVLTVGLSKLVRERPDDPVIWLADWLLANNPNKPKESDNMGTNPRAVGKCK